MSKFERGKKAYTKNLEFLPVKTVFGLDFLSPRSLFTGQQVYLLFFWNFFLSHVLRVRTQGTQFYSKSIHKAKEIQQKLYIYQLWNFKFKPYLLIFHCHSKEHTQKLTIKYLPVILKKNLAFCQYTKPISTNKTAKEMFT